ncbi:MAG: 50S ribosomal protein L17 [Planctomycetota bacterium]|jgi:large subunit ribosomal protein L17
MRHRKGNEHLNRTSAHAQAMVRNTVVNLFRRERIRTTLKKAKLVRRWAEKMITLGKKGTLHARRQALAFLHSKPAVAALFRTIGPRYNDRNGGYTRIIRLAETLRPAASDRVADFKPPMGSRLGDGAPMAILELVEADVAPRKKRRGPAPEPFKPRRELRAQEGEAEAKAAEEAAEQPEPEPEPETGAPDAIEGEDDPPTGEPEARGDTDG